MKLILTYTYLLIRFTFLILLFQKTIKPKMIGKINITGEKIHRAVPGPKAGPWARAGGERSCWCEVGGWVRAPGPGRLTPLPSHGDGDWDGGELRGEEPSSFLRRKGRLWRQRLQEILLRRQRLREREDSRTTGDEGVGMQSWGEGLGFVLF